MPAWLAMLNPPRKHRRKSRRKSRRLNWWAKMVKKYGGIKEAMKHRRKARKSSKRRSVVSRRISRRSRSRSHVGRRATMARRRGSRRALRRNGRRARLVHRRRGSRRRNPLWKRAAGFGGIVKTRRGRRRRAGGLFSGRHSRGAHRLRRRAGRWAWNPPVVPVSWNPPRRRRRASRKVRRSIRRYRSNSVLPISWNPGGALSGALGRVKRFANVAFWTQTAIPAAAGFVGTKTVGSMIQGALGKVVTLPTGIPGAAVRIASDALAASGLAWLVSRFVGAKQGEAVFLGGVVGITHSLLKEVLGGTTIGNAIGLSGLGDDLSERMRQAVAARVASELSGLGEHITMDSLQNRMVPGLSEYVSDTALRARAGYGASPSGRLSDYDPTNDSTTF